MTDSDSANMEPDAKANPIQRLCSDILAEIFTFCLPDIPNRPWGVCTISSHRAPLLLCSVCSSWRSLAIATPRLWQTLHLHFGSSSRFLTDTESVTSGLRTWLDRSRSLPLFIRASFWTAYPPESDKTSKCRLMVEMLSQEISRWESFELFEYSCQSRIWITPPHFDILPMLQTFEISYSSIDGMPFAAAPRLKILRLHSHCLDPTSMSRIPCHQLVELTIEQRKTPIPVVLDFIQRCPRLESLSLPVENGSVASRSITQHDTLRRLHLHKLPYINAVTDHLTLPALTNLDLESQFHQPPVSEVEAKFRCARLVDFFTRSNCKLQELELKLPGFGPGELLECLSHQSCQTLTHLLIRGNEDLPPMVDREILIRLTYSDVDDVVPLCPKLDDLGLWHCSWSDSLSPDLLGKMIQSRCFGRARDAQLRSFMLFSPYQAISSEDRKLLRFAEDNGGLELRIEYGP